MIDFPAHSHGVKVYTGCKQTVFLMESAFFHLRPFHLSKCACNFYRDTLYFLSPGKDEGGLSLVHEDGNSDTSNDELQVVAAVSE